MATSTGERPSPAGPTGLPSNLSLSAGPISPRALHLKAAFRPQSGVTYRPAVGMPTTASRPPGLRLPGMPGSLGMPRSSSSQGLALMPGSPKPPKTDFKHRPLTHWEAEALLKRYPGNTVRTLLREVASQCSSKINWVRIHQRVGAAIKGPREAQAIWRHLAYGHALPEKLAPGQEPLDNDSDTDEFDVTKPSTPGISIAVQMDATAWVKHDLAQVNLEVAASGALRRRPPQTGPVARPSNSAPLGSGIRSGGMSPIGSSLLGQKRPAHILTQTSSGGRPNSPGFSGTNRPSPLSSQYSPHVSPHVPQNPSPLGPNKRRRQVWSDGEDKTLIEAVQKHGEQWEQIQAQYFSDDRTAAQLWQRWALIKRPATHTPEAGNPKPFDASGTDATRVARAPDGKMRPGGGWGGQSKSAHRALEKE